MHQSADRAPSDALASDAPTDDLRVHNADAAARSLTVRVFEADQVVHYDRLHLAGGEVHRTDAALDAGRYVVEVDADTGAHDRARARVRADESATVEVRCADGLVDVALRREG